MSKKGTKASVPVTKGGSKGTNDPMDTEDGKQEVSQTPMKPKKGKKGKASAASSSSPSSSSSKKKKGKKKPKKKSKKGTKVFVEGGRCALEEGEVWDIMTEVAAEGEDHVTAVHELRAAVEPLLLESEERRHFVTTVTLVRYLRARDWNVANALKMLTETLEWRDTMQPQHIGPEQVKVEMENEGKMYAHGVDREGRPIIYMKPRNDNTMEREPKVAYLIYCMERAIRSMKETETGVTKLNILIDFEGYSHMRGMRLAKVNIEVLKILQNMYPERLCRAFVVRQPWIFSAFWAILTPFMDPVTKQKLKFIKAGGRNDTLPFPELLDFIDADQLEAEYGGTDDFVYNFEDVWKEAIDEWEEFKGLREDEVSPSDGDDEGDDGDEGDDDVVNHDHDHETSSAVSGDCDDNDDEEEDQAAKTE